jgi:hypothetical protein
MEPSTVEQCIGKTKTNINTLFIAPVFETIQFVGCNTTISQTFTNSYTRSNNQK